MAEAEKRSFETRPRIVRERIPPMGLSSVDWRFQRLSHRFYALGLPDTRSISNRL
jgi:hypothetical protein